MLLSTFNAINKSALTEFANSIRSFSSGEFLALRVKRTVTPKANNLPSNRWAISKTSSDSATPLATSPLKSPPQLGSITIILFANAGLRTACFVLSRSALGAPPETVFTNRIKAIKVPGPHFPSTTTPTDF